MENAEKSIGEILSLKPIHKGKHVGGLTAMEIWYDNVLRKKLSQLTVLDVIRMLREEMMLSIAIPYAFDLLKEDVFGGDQYEGQLLLTLLERRNRLSIMDSNRLDSLVAKSNGMTDSRNWFYPEDKERFCNAIRKE